MAGVLTGTKREVSAAQNKDDWLVGGGTERPADGLCHHLQFSLRRVST